jgi:DNA-binding response OmpR family regulator
MNRQKPLVLVADDDEDILELIRLRLDRCGYELVVAHTGAEALAVASSWHPDLALLDVNMPGMDGYAVIAELRGDPATSDIPVILLTARAQTADVSHGFALGADDYITKPFSPQELEGRVASQLRQTDVPTMQLRPAAAEG